MELNKDLYIDGVSDYLEQQENLYNSSTDTTNSYINSEGKVTSLSTWRATDYIPVVPGSTFYYEGLINNGVAPMSAFYNSSKQFISSFKQVQGINNITIPSGARYIRFSLNNSDINLFKFDNKSYYGKYLNKGDGILIPYTLYDNSSGSTGNITLSDNVENYKYIEIYYKDEANAILCQKTYNNSAILTVSRFASDGANFQPSRTIQLSQNTITTTRYGKVTITNSGSVSVSSSNNIYITRVIGYK